MVRARAAFVVMLAVAALAGACGLVIGLEPPQETPLPPLPPPTPPPPPVVDPCAHVAPPAKPPKDDDPTLELEPFWVAMRTTRFGADAGLRGFDLDGVCTCDRSAGAAYDGGVSCRPRASAAVQCDDDGGIDNQGEQLFRSVGGAFADPNSGLANFIAAGELTMLMYIAKYNGKANDVDVGVGFALSDGLLTKDCDPRLDLGPGGGGAGEGGPCDGGFCAPRWRGCDQWHPAKDSVVPAAPPRTLVPVRFGNGYVRDGVLVVTGNVDVPFYLNSSSLQITSPTFTARLEEAARRDAGDPRRFRLRDGLLAGRLPLEDLARVLFEGSFQNFYFCESPAIFKETMGRLCPNVDSNRSADLDRQAGVVCNAISMAIPLETELSDIDLSDASAPVSTGSGRCNGKVMPPLNELCPP